MRFHIAWQSTFVLVCCAALIPTVHAATPAPILFDSPRGGEIYFPGQQQTVRLNAKTRAKSVLIELSRDGGATFTELGRIDNTVKDKNQLKFPVAGPVSNQCILRASAGASTGFSDSFAISASSTGAPPPSSVGATELADGSTITAKLADGAVTTQKLADSSVTNPKLAPHAVSSDKVSSGPASSGMVLTADGLGNATWGSLSPASGFTGNLGGDVTGPQSATVVATVGGVTAANVASGANAANAATTAGTPNTIVKRDANGNIPGTTTGAVILGGDVTGPSGTNAVASVGGVTAANIAFGANAANAATDANTPNTIVKRDANGNFAGSADSFSGPLAGDVTGTQNSTSISDATVTGKALTGFASAAGPIASSDSILSAIDKLDGNLALKAPLDSPAFTGTVNASSVTLSDNLTLPASTATTGILYSGTTPLLHTFGTDNFFAGLGAGNLALTGSGNTVSGSGALSANTTGRRNTANGYKSLYANTTGQENAAVGWEALFSNTTGSFNTAIGSFALGNTRTVGPDIGEHNTAIGWNALYNNVIGSSNIAVGYRAGFNIGLNSTGGGHNICIGSAGEIGDNNVIRIGEPGTHTATSIAGIYTATTPGGVPVYINNNGHLGTSTSSRRFKENIKEMGTSSDALLKLRPVTFIYKKELDPKSIPQWGLIAEEVAAINPDWVVRDEKGEIYTVRYEQINAMLLNEFLKEHKKVEALEARLGELSAKFQSLAPREGAK